MDILSIDRNNVNLDDDNFDKNDPKPIFPVIVMALHNKL